jgi:hypothetical protein
MINSLKFVKLKMPGNNSGRHPLCPETSSRFSYNYPHPAQILYPGKPGFEIALPPGGGSQ